MIKEEEEAQSNLFDDEEKAKDDMFSYDYQSSCDLEDENVQELQEEDKRLMAEMNISPNEVVIIASFNLPVNVKKNENGTFEVQPSSS